MQRALTGSGTIPSNYYAIPTNCDAPLAGSVTLPAGTAWLPANYNAIPSRSNTIPSNCDTGTQGSNTVPANCDAVPARGALQLEGIVSLPSRGVGRERCSVSQEGSAEPGTGPLYRNGSILSIVQVSPPRLTSSPGLRPMKSLARSDS